MKESGPRIEAAVWETIVSVVKLGGGGGGCIERLPVDERRFYEINRSPINMPAAIQSDRRFPFVA